LNEPASEAAQDALARDFGQLVTSVLTAVELRSGLAKYQREGVLTAAQADTIYERAQQDLSSTPRRLELTREVLTEAVRLFKTQMALPLRTLDALHIATCLRYGTNGFVTNDKQQARLARAVGLDAHWLGGSLEFGTHP
jgi:predicted nucleic acid-binding protein